ncbi:MAG: hypothetical protein BGO57_13150 [Sphingomonadales bacterium 63-6]|nr:MAG: hypothetical protein BGO57_13150 [Sphingomonadales bacterium 63-6]
MIYQNGDISVDEAFARFGSKTYAINKINSTEVRERIVPGARGYYLWFPIAAFLTLPVLVGLFSSGNQEGATGGLIIIGLPLALFWWLAIRSYRRRAAKYSYELYLTMSSRDQQALVSPDRVEVEKLRAAIETAMAASR